MFQNLKLRDKMLILILGINVIMFLIIFGVYYGFLKELVVKETQKQAVEKVEGVKSNLEAYLNEKAKIAWTFCLDDEIRTWLKRNKIKRVKSAMDPEYGKIISQLKRYVKEDGEIKSAFIASEKSQWYYESAERPIVDDNYRVGKRPWYQRAVKIGHLCFDIDVDAVDFSIAANVRVPIYDDNKKLLGVGGVDLSLQHFTGVMKRLGNVFKTGEVYLIGNDGTFYYHPDKEYVLKKKITDFKDDGRDYKGIAAVSKKIKNQENGISEVVFNGEHRYFMYTPVKSVGWSLVLSVSEGEINSPLVRLTRISLFIIIVTLIFLIVAVLFITGTISKPVNHLVSMLKEIAEGDGDLTRRLEIGTKDEMGELARWFNVFIERVHSIVSQVRDNAEGVDRATREISTTSSELSTGIEEQTSQLSEVAVSMQQMTSGIVQNSRGTDEVAKRAEEANSVAGQGLISIQDTREGMNKISTTADKAAEIIRKLSERVNEIGEVVWVISDIAAQTKVLALNASIEAAAATDNKGGEGFGVVAEEIRSLVKQTTEATENIGETISAIRQYTESALLSMKDVRGVVEKGLEISSRTEEIFEDISKAVSASLTEIKQIAVVSKEQSSGAETVSHSISSVSSVAKQSARGVEMLSEAADKLNKQTEELRNIVNQFKLEEK